MSAPVSECTRVACWLSTQGGLVSFPLITIAGLVDGINPCAIGMMLLLLGYLLVFSSGDQGKKDHRRVFFTGAAYILAVFATYITIGLVFYSIFSKVQLGEVRGLLNRILAAILGVAGVIQIKDFFRPDWPIHLRIPTASKSKLMPLIERASLPAAVVLGVLVTLLETPCSLPIYVGTATVLAQSGLPLIGVIAYFLYYNFLFVLPLIVVLLVVWKAKQVIQLKEWEHLAERWMKLAIGIVLIGMSLFLFTSS